MYQPLADLIRPQTLDDVCGQTHILGPNGLLRRIIESGQIPNMIFYGPSGTGKTTIANIIAKQTQRKLCKARSWPRTVCCSTSTKFSIFQKSSSRRCWNTSKTARSR